MEMSQREEERVWVPELEGEDRFRESTFTGVRCRGGFRQDGTLGAAYQMWKHVGQWADNKVAEW